ncbi:MAG TPA: septal ring lytic transglycosylase RlpA family protein [Burkholderiales bacterium]|nr:septal ring lytic transglycosylase RlpA family protein [Burkholderiales bacterium]
MRPLAWALVLCVAGCAAPLKREGAADPAKRETPAEPAKRGAYYKDDGPGDNPPANLSAIPDAEPKAEPLHRFANRPYQVFGKDYVPLSALGSFRQRGVASWYGKRFHGSLTSSGERYDMYAMTAAHPTLPVPSYARVTNVASGKSVVVRVNDRGPFHADRVIDLSYTAAYRLGYADAGSALVDVEAILPGTVAAAPAQPVPPPSPQSVAPATVQAKGVYLQLGAFTVRENAELFRARMMREFAWLSETIQVIAGESLFRLHLGPYRTPDEARAIAERIRAQVSFSPLIVVR